MITSAMAHSVLRLSINPSIKNEFFLRFSTKLRSRVVCTVVVHVTAAFVHQSSVWTAVSWVLACNDGRIVIDGSRNARSCDLFWENTTSKVLKCSSWQASVDANSKMELDLLRMYHCSCWSRSMNAVLAYLSHMHCENGSTYNPTIFTFQIGLGV